MVAQIYSASTVFHQSSILTDQCYKACLSNKTKVQGKSDMVAHLVTERLRQEEPEYEVRLDYTRACSKNTNMALADKSVASYSNNIYIR